MGCIVNGPGEMADADFGYVGGAPGKIDLYVGKVLQPIFGSRIFLCNTFTPCDELSFPMQPFSRMRCGSKRCVWLSFWQTVVKRGIAMERATDALIQLIRDHGRWVDPPAEE